MLIDIVIIIMIIGRSILRIISLSMASISMIIVIIRIIVMNIRIRILIIYDSLADY